MINRLCEHRKKIQAKKTDESNVSNETIIDIEERFHKESQTQPFMIVSEV